MSPSNPFNKSTPNKAAQFQAATDTSSQRKFKKQQWELSKKELKQIQIIAQCNSLNPKSKTAFLLTALLLSQVVIEDCRAVSGESIGQDLSKKSDQPNTNSTNLAQNNLSQSEERDFCDYVLVGAKKYLGATQKFNKTSAHACDLVAPNISKTDEISPQNKEDKTPQKLNSTHHNQKPKNPQITDQEFKKIFDEKISEESGKLNFEEGTSVEEKQKFTKILFDGCQKIIKMGNQDLVLDFLHGGQGFLFSRAEFFQNSPASAIYAAQKNLIILNQNIPDDKFALILRHEFEHFKQFNIAKIPTLKELQDCNNSFIDIVKLSLACFNDKSISDKCDPDGKLRKVLQDYLDLGLKIGQDANIAQGESLSASDNSVFSIEKNGDKITFTDFCDEEKARSAVASNKSARANSDHAFSQRALRALQNYRKSKLCQIAQEQGLALDGKEIVLESQTPEMVHLFNLLVQILDRIDVFEGQAKYSSKYIEPSSDSYDKLYGISKAEKYRFVQSAYLKNLKLSLDSYREFKGVDEAVKKDLLQKYYDGKITHFQTFLMVSRYLKIKNSGFSVEELEKCHKELFRREQPEEDVLVLKKAISGIIEQKAHQSEALSDLICNSNEEFFSQESFKKSPDHYESQDNIVAIILGVFGFYKMEKGAIDILKKIEDEIEEEIPRILPKELKLFRPEAIEPYPKIAPDPKSKNPKSTQFQEQTSPIIN